MHLLGVPCASVLDMQKMQELAEAEFLLADEVMSIARISRRTLDRWVADKTITAYQVSPRTVRRFKRAEVVALLSGERAL